MCYVCRAILAAGLTVALAATLSARPDDEAKARPATPRARADALYRYAVGLLQQRDDRLVTATRTLEEAVRLDPEAIHPRVELIDLYVALGRPNDAGTHCRGSGLRPDPTPNWRGWPWQQCLGWCRQPTDSPTIVLHSHPAIE